MTSTKWNYRIKSVNTFEMNYYDTDLRYENMENDD